MASDSALTALSEIGGDGNLLITRQDSPPYKSTVFVAGEAIGVVSYNASALEWLLYILSEVKNDKGED